VFPLNLYARVRFLLCMLHTRPRVQRAPGLPCALCALRGWNVTQSSGGSRREKAVAYPHRCLTIESEVSPRHCEERQRRSNPCCSGWIDGLLRFARNDVERANFAEIVGWVERSETHHLHCFPSSRWVSLRSTHPTTVAYLIVIASPLRSALAIRPTCWPVSSSTAPFWLVSTIARAPRPTASPAPAAP
jgi:hypothetical protein